MNHARTVLTGATGWIGSQLAQVLPYVHTLPARTVLAKPDTLTDVLTQGDVVVNAAGLRSGADDDMYLANVGLTKQLVRAAEARGCRVIHLGSAAEYGPGHESVLSEDTTPHPRSYYGITKLIATELLQNWGHATVLRLFNIASSPPQPGSPLADVVGRVRHGIDSQRPAELLAAQTIRDWVSLGHVVRCVQHAVVHDEPGVFNICSGIGASMNDIAAAMLSLRGAPQLGVLDLRAASSNTVVGDGSRWRSLSGLNEMLGPVDIARIALTDRGSVSAR